MATAEAQGSAPAAAEQQVQARRRARIQKEDFERAGSLTDLAVDAIVQAAGNAGPRRLSTPEFNRLLSDLRACLKQYTQLPVRAETSTPKSAQHDRTQHG
jgi:hypothetical protein